MPNRDDRITLRQMLDHAREAVELVRDLKYDELNNQRVLCLALIQLCQIVGEAAVRIFKGNSIQAPANTLGENNFPSKSIDPRI